MTMLSCQSHGWQTFSRARQHLQPLWNRYFSSLLPSSCYPIFVYPAWNRQLISRCLLLLKVCPICLTNPRDMAFGCGHTVSRLQFQLLFSLFGLWNSVCTRIKISFWSLFIRRWEFKTEFHF